MPIRLAASTICFRHAPLDTALIEIRNAGLTAVDLAVIPEFCPHFDAAGASEAERDRFVSQIMASGFVITAVTSVPGHFNAPDADFDRIVAAGHANVALTASATSTSGTPSATTSSIPRVTAKSSSPLCSPRWRKPVTTGGARSSWRRLARRWKTGVRTCAAPSITC